MILLNLKQQILIKADVDQTDFDNSWIWSNRIWLTRLWKKEFNQTENIKPVIDQTELENTEFDDTETVEKDDIISRPKSVLKSMRDTLPLILCLLYKSADRHSTVQCVLNSERLTDKTDYWLPLGMLPKLKLQSECNFGWLWRGEGSKNDLLTFH